MPRPCSPLCTRVSPLPGAHLNLTLLTPQVSGSLLLLDLESIHFRGFSRHHHSVISPLHQPLSQLQPNIWFKASTILLISFDHHPLPHRTTNRTLPTQLSYTLLLLRVPEGCIIVLSTAGLITVACICIFLYTCVLSCQ